MKNSGTYIKCSIALMLMCVQITPIWAQSITFCSAINSAINPEDDNADLIIALEEMSLPTAECKHALGLGGVSMFYCSLAFEYRSPEATQVFEHLIDEIAGCFGTYNPTNKDQLVNHPDSYDLRQFRSDHGTVSLSLKDKGAQKQTLVFLRLERFAVN